MKRCSALAAVFLLCACELPRSSSQAVTQFDPKFYPAASFHVSHRDYPLGNFTVRIIHAKRAYEVSAPPPSYCRAWLQVRDRIKVLRQSYFDDIEPVGSYFGIFLPEHQPLKNLFIALKEGDYDGRLLLVGMDGGLANLPGGDFFLTPDDRYLIGSHASDYESPIVIDLTRRQIVIDGAQEKLPGVGDWYLDKGGYFYTEDEENGESPNPNQATVAVRRLDLKQLKIRRDVLTKEQLAAARKQGSIAWLKSRDCTSAP